jgi:hypothetical protein
MATPWTKKIKQTGKLSVYADPSMGGIWSGVFRRALHDFNTLSSHHKLRVTLTESKTGGGADVTVAAASGVASSSYGGDSMQDTFTGKELKGRTHQYAYKLGAAQAMEKAFVFVPATPQISSPNGIRAAGADVLRVILVHELFHAAGLQNGDHTNDDLFYGNPQPAVGDTPAGDRLSVSLGGKQVKLPPLILSAVTAGKVRDLWT